MRKYLIAVAILVALVKIPSVAPMEMTIHDDVIEGRIFEATTRRGIPNLTVRLIPPRVTQQAEKITTTKANGEFEFRSVDKGKYLLEVYQGLTLLYRDVVDTNGDRHMEISFRKKPR